MILCLSNARSGDLHFGVSFVALRALVREIIQNTIHTHIHTYIPGVQQKKLLKLLARVQERVCQFYSNLLKLKSFDAAPTFPHNCCAPVTII